MNNRKIILAILVSLVLLGILLGLYGVYKHYLYIKLPNYKAVTKVYWLNQEWSKKTSEAFHHADEGTQTLGIPYEWFVALEQPRFALIGDVGRLNDPDYLDRYGFIPGATIGGEVPPPIGFAKSDDPDMLKADGTIWRNTQTGNPMHAMDLHVRPATRGP